MKTKLYTILSIWVLFSTAGWCQSISVTGAWNCVVSNLDLQSGPGSNLRTIYTSATNAAYIDVSAYPHNWKWQVQVGLHAINWHPDLQIWAQRTGNGSSPPGKISGGTSYQRVINIGQLFFWGSSSCQDIPIQYEIRNMSAVIPANSYSVEIEYTLEDQ
jgi:hypothetical protein